MDEKTKIVWVLGRRTHDCDCPGDWEIVGIYESEFEAASAAEDPLLDFVGPVEMNRPFYYDRGKWAGAYYPLLPSREE